MAAAFEVRKDRLQDTRLREQPDAPLADGQVRVRIERFALTANNITYAAFGEAMHYWDFFPGDDAAWGRIPVWGFATVLQSAHPGVAVAESLYGYFPMAEQLVLTPGHLSVAGFSDLSPHRAGLPRVYNRYLRTASDPFDTPETRDAQALLRPLFTTSWLIDDFLADNAFFGAQVMLLSSASSKTAYGTAAALAQRAGVEVVGLTSAPNLAFCQSLGCYSRVLTYEQLGALAAGTPVVYVDFAGNASLRQSVHQRFPALRYSCAIGGTHVQQLGGTQGLPGPRPVLFFAPSQVAKRHKDWGADVFEQRLLQAWQAFVARVTDPASPWLVVQHHRGPEPVRLAYLQLLAGRVEPREGHVLSL